MDENKALEKILTLQKVSTNFYQNNSTVQWKEPFNQATFFNFDTDHNLYIQKWVLAPGVLTGGNVYPTFLEISLNHMEINDTMFIVDTDNSSTANWQVIYTQYLGVE